MPDLWRAKLRDSEVIVPQRLGFMNPVWGKGNQAPDLAWGKGNQALDLAWGKAMAG